MLEILRRRRSVRRFQPRPLEPGVIAELEEVLLRSPSSRNLRPWEFVLVDDPALLDRLSQSKEHGSGFVRGAAMAVVICGLPEVSDVWVEDCSIASILVQLYAETVPGMGSCWVQIRNRKHDPSTSSQEFVRSVLGLAGDRSVESIIALGYEAERGDPIAVEELPGGKVRRNAEGSPQ